MTILTLIFIALFLAAWKAPAWVKEIGKFAAVFGFLSTLIGFSIMAKDVSAAGGIDARLLWHVLRMATITPVYGLLIYLVSLIIRIVQKPRI